MWFRTFSLIPSSYSRKWQYNRNLVQHKAFVSHMGSVVSQLTKQSGIVNMSSPQAQFVQNAIRDNKVVIFSKSYCPYCTMAKDQFKKLAVNFHVIELDQRNDGYEIQSILGEITGGSTVPRCFIDGKFVGGGTDVKKMYDQGILQKYFG